VKEKWIFSNMFFQAFDILIQTLDLEEHILTKNPINVWDPVLELKRACS
jgi:hypothetical protein